MFALPLNGDLLILSNMEGVVVGSDLTLEWALPWWWERYCAHNRYPVAFIDLGLSFEQKAWCRKRGDLIPLLMVDFTENVETGLAKEWEEKTGTFFWPSREVWFKKPFACLKSPFDYTLWIDIDCEIRGSIAPLFQYAKTPTGFAVAKEQLDFSKPYQAYNSGVIAFRKDHPILLSWAKACLKMNRKFRGDDDVLAYMLFEEGIGIEEIPPQFNLSRCLDEDPNAVILHWHGHHGKTVIRAQTSKR